jgi:microcystin-dependent protein
MAYITPHVWTSEEATVALMNEINDNLKALFPVGSYTYLCRSATTSETLVSDCWLECNGVSVLRADYPDLNTLLSGLGYPFGTVDGTHMTLPDAQGRVIVSQASGGHADVNGLGDSDGLAKASRTPEGSVSTGGFVSGGTVSGSVTGGTVTVASNGVITYADGSLVSPTIGSPGSPALTGATFSGSLTGATFSGSGAVPGNYVVGGVLFIKAFT